MSPSWFRRPHAASQGTSVEHFSDCQCLTNLEEPSHLSAIIKLDPESVIESAAQTATALLRPCQLNNQISGFEPKGCYGVLLVAPDIKSK